MAGQSRSQSDYRQYVGPTDMAVPMKVSTGRVCMYDRWPGLAEPSVNLFSIAREPNVG